jgi:membrane protein implicated in regulation of membrane protease activity
MDLFTIYLICFGVGLFFSVVSAFFADFGGHDSDLHGGHPHVEGGGAGGPEMPGFAPLSPTTIATFVTAFGGLGLIFSSISWTSSVWLSVPLAVVGGLGIAALVFLLFRKIFASTQSSSEGRVRELFGRSATVITPIAAGGIGEIAYEQGGTRYTAPARELESGAIPSGATVRIVRVVGTQFHVIKE